MESGGSHTVASFTPSLLAICARRGQIRKLIGHRRRLVESEVQHIVLARQVMTLDEVTALLRATLAVVTRYVPGSKDRAAITEEIVALVDSDPNTPLGAHVTGMPDDER